MSRQPQQALEPPKAGGTSGPKNPYIRNTMLWATEQLPAKEADKGFYRISGVSRSGKSHLTKLFILDVLRDVENNPKAKLIIYEPKREFFAWMSSLGLEMPIEYLMPSDMRSKGLNFSDDYSELIDAYTLAQAFFPINPRENQQFFSDSVRTIVAQLYLAIKERVKTPDLRLLCHVLESEKLTERVLGHNPYYVQAQKLVNIVGEKLDRTSSDIFKTLHSRIAKMKILAAHIDKATEAKGPFSLKEFLGREEPGVLVISKDSVFKDIQDPLNGIIFLRLIDLLDSKQADPDRKIFVVIDEFPTLAGDLPCPGIIDMFLRLSSRGVVILITYQAHTTLRRIYGDTVTEFLGQCANVIHLKQTDPESAKFAAEDLGMERGYEAVNSVSYGAGDAWNVTRNQQWYDRTIYSETFLRNQLPLASKERGIEGLAKSSVHGPDPWFFPFPPKFIDSIPSRRDNIKEYEPRPPEDQWLRELEEEERLLLLNQTAAEAKAEADFEALKARKAKLAANLDS